ncbi:gastric inhibitory polypeptide receptor [Paroedura picta]|uniref:gastric inhibitory polypeptide receptor n=1 Tax=Paroedura picta TaxID=143630 RepID=UPI004057988E
MWEPLGLLLLFMLLQRIGETHALGSSAKEVVEAWRWYQEACHRKMLEDPPPTSLVCNRTFDMYACWSDAQPNTSARVPCPWYLPWHQQVQGGFVFQKCGPDGQWVLDGSGAPWRNHSQCEVRKEELPSQRHLWILDQIRLMYTVGYSVSLVALLGALFLLASFRKLRCVRNFIHMNLFFSFMLRAASILSRDGLLWLHFSRNALSRFPMGQAPVGCRMAQTLSQYCVGTNYGWLLVEGLYLHNLLGLKAFSEESCFPGYLLLGWGAPVLFVVPWVIMRYLYENKECWERNEHMGYWWIIRCPILLAIFVNFVIFIRIIKILVSKLQAQQMHQADYRFRLAKSTLTLIPLLGIHEVVFALVTEEQAGGILHYIKYFFELFLNSFQGLLVSILYCFFNKEVQAEIWRKWQQCQLAASLLEKPGRSRRAWMSWRSRRSHCCQKESSPQLPGGPEGGAPPKATGLQPAPLGGKSCWYTPIRTKAGDRAGGSPEAKRAPPSPPNSC